MRSIRAASSGLWVAISAAVPVSRTTSSRIANTSSAVCGSRLPVGSSARIRPGPLASARRDRHPLLLAARQLGRPVVEARQRARAARAAPSALRLRLALAAPGDQLRHRHVLERGEVRQQVVELVDEADPLAAQAGALGIAQAVAGPPVDRDLAGAGPLQQAGDVQQRRLAGARRPDQRRDRAGAAATRSMPCSTSRARPGPGRSGAGCPAAPARRNATHSAAPRPDRAAPPARPDRSWRGTTGPAPIATTLSTSPISTLAGSCGEEADLGRPQLGAEQAFQAAPDRVDVEREGEAQEEARAACRRCRSRRR